MGNRRPIVEFSAVSLDEAQHRMGLGGDDGNVFLKTEFAVQITKRVDTLDSSAGQMVISDQGVALTSKTHNFAFFQVEKEQIFAAPLVDRVYCSLKIGNRL